MKQFFSISIFKDHNDTYPIKALLWNQGRFTEYVGLVI